MFRIINLGCCVAKSVVRSTNAVKCLSIACNSLKLQTNSLSTANVQAEPITTTTTTTDNASVAMKEFQQKTFNSLKSGQYFNPAEFKYFKHKRWAAGSLTLALMCSDEELEQFLKQGLKIY